MASRVPQLGAYFGKQYLDLIERPAVVELEQAQTQSLDAVDHGTELQQASVTQAFLFGPRPGGQLEFVHRDVDKACSFQAVFEEGGRGAQVDADFLGRQILLRTPRHERGARIAGCRLHDGFVVHLLQLNVAAWLGVAGRVSCASQCQR